MRPQRELLGRLGLDALALKPAEVDVGSAATLPVERVVVDWEGNAHLPDPRTLDALADGLALRVTVPVRADGFDPLGDDSLMDRVPDGADVALVAGHPAYLSDVERTRAVAPRFGGALERFPDAWVGTEGVERIALATGAPQFELLAGDTERRLGALRDAGFRGDLAVYAPVVATPDEDAILDAVGGYVARRRPVAAALSEGTPTDARATGRARRILLAACREYALVGDAGAIHGRVRALREAGVDHLVGYPARGLDAFFDGDRR